MGRRFKVVRQRSAVPALRVAPARPQRRDDVAIIKESMQRGAVSDAWAPMTEEKPLSDKCININPSLSRAHKSLSVWRLGRVCQLIWPYAQMLVS
jgi:hypothetical protein